MELAYYSCVLISLMYLIYRYNKSQISLLIILCFYSGLAAYFGGAIENVYKVILLVFSIFFIFKHRPFDNMSKSMTNILIFFVIFSTFFFLSGIINNTYALLILSQYTKYSTPFILLILFSFLHKKKAVYFSNFQNLFFLLLKIQIVLSFIKYFTIGIQEWVVGSIAYTGGGVATIIPLLGFSLIWLTKNGDLKSNNWIFIVLLLFVGFMSTKRAIWFIMPIYIFIFSIYVQRKKLTIKYLKLIPLIPLIFYIGARSNPTLNKEGKAWGSFDLDFIINYAKEYSFGKEKGINEKSVAEGRGGVTNMLLKKITDPSSLNWQDFFGFGLEEIATKDYDSFNQDKYNVNSKGAVTGIYRTYITNGVIGVIFIFIYIFLTTNLIKEKRLKYTILGLVLWDYLYYPGIILTTQATAILFFYIILYCNTRYDTMKK